MSLNLCTKCNEGYYPIENNPLNLGEYINCYNQLPEWYYLDTIFSLYRKCFDSCETCESKGDNNSHKCLKCKNNFRFIIEKDNSFSCYENCIHYYYIDNNNISHCSLESSCPQEYPHLIIEKNECVYIEFTTHIMNQPTTQIIQFFNHPTTQMINKEITTQIINQKIPTTQSIYKALTTQIIKEQTTQINNKQPATQFKFLEPTTQVNYLEPTTQSINEGSTSQIKYLDSTSYIKDIASTILIKYIETTTQIKETEKLTEINNQDLSTSIKNKENMITDLSEGKIHTSIHVKKYITNKDIEYMINNILNKEIRENETFYDVIMNIIESNFTNDYYDKSNLDIGLDESIEINNFSKNMKITFTTTEN